MFIDFKEMEGWREWKKGRREREGGKERGRKGMFSDQKLNPQLVDVWCDIPIN